MTAGNGVAGSTGLAAAASIFNWTAHPFNWNAADFQSVSLQMDYRTDGSAAFDDDRLSWTIASSSTDSTNQFGVQLDTVEDGGIATYWRNSTGGRVQTPIVPLPALAANTWYRLRADITKLTADLGEDRCELRAVGLQRQPNGRRDDRQRGGHERVDGRRAGH